MLPPRMLPSTESVRATAMPFTLASLMRPSDGKQLDVHKFKERKAIKQLNNAEHDLE